MKARVLFSGYYGLGNAGDEAVLAASVAGFRKRRPGIELAALSAEPEATAAALKIEAAPRMVPRAVLAELRRCTLFLSGGGSLLQDRTSLKSLLYYLAVLDAARRRRGVRTMIFAQGIGPLIRPAARRLTAQVLSRVDAITVRDPGSAGLLREIGVKGPAIEVTADPVFDLEPEETERVRALSAERPVLAISLRPWAGVDRLLPPLAEALKGVGAGAGLQAWSLYPSEDLAPCEALARLVPGLSVVREPLRPAEWMALAGRVDAVLGMRLHALIFAAARAVPVVGISYDPKVDALLERLGTRPAGTAAHLDPEAVAEAVRGALSSDPAGRGEREERASALRELAGRNVERALELVG